MEREEFMAEMADLIAISMSSDRGNSGWLKDKIISNDYSVIRAFIEDIAYKRESDHRKYLENLRCRVLFEDNFHWTDLIKPYVEVDTPPPVSGDTPQET
jgi:hypothetical protein